VGILYLVSFLPITFIIRPRVSTPTGIRMGYPVSRTFCPRTRPSVPSMAIVRTVLSPAKTGKMISSFFFFFSYRNSFGPGCELYLPKCWATSRMRRGDRSDTTRALRMGGSWSSNWTSTTAPITATIRPLPPFPAALGAAVAYEVFSEIG